MPEPSLAHAPWLPRNMADCQHHTVGFRQKSLYSLNADAPFGPTIVPANLGCVWYRHCKGVSAPFLASQPSQSYLVIFGGHQLCSLSVHVRSKSLELFYTLKVPYAQVLRQRSPRALLVPVALGVPVERRKHDGEHTGSVVTDEAHDVLVVPVVEGSLCHLARRNGVQRAPLRLSRPAPPCLHSVWETGSGLPGNGGWRHTWRAGGREAPSLC